MQGDFRGAVEAHRDNGRPCAHRRVADHVMIFPGAGAHGARQDINTRSFLSSHNADIMDLVDADDYLDFADEYRKKFPNATRAKIKTEYLKTKQGKQAMNTRLLGG